MQMHKACQQKKCKQTMAQDDKVTGDYIVLYISALFDLLRKQARTAQYTVFTIHHHTGLLSLIACI